MIKKRVVAALPIRNGIVVQSFGFRTHLPVGSAPIVVENLNRWGVDEIVMVDIDAGPAGRSPDFRLVGEVSRECYVPLTVGGGIRSVEDITGLVHRGADKVSLNRSAVTDPALIEEASRIFGDQCIVVSIDARKTEDGGYEAVTDSGREPTGMTPASLARRAEEAGAGEIFLNSIDRDGSKRGYDLELIERVTDAVGIPVIVCGGVGHPEHLRQGLMETAASACAVGNMFHFTEHSVVTAKAYVRARGAEVRSDTYATYGGFEFDGGGRVAKRPDEELLRLRFKHYPREVI